MGEGVNTGIMVVGWLFASGGVLTIAGAILRHVIAVEKRLARIETKLGISG